MKPLAWKAYYTKGRRYESTSDTWDQLPELGCLLVVVYMDKLIPSSGHPYRKIVGGGDWVWIDHEGMVHCSGTNDERGFWIEAPPEIPREKLKRGQWATDEEMKAVQAEAMEARWPSP